MIKQIRQDVKVDLIRHLKEWLPAGSPLHSARIDPTARFS
jgi:hypothetical protein